MRCSVAGIVLFVLVMALALTGLPRPVQGQVVSGRALDALGSAPVAGATVALVGEDGSIQSSAVTNDGGLFVVAAKRPGRYSLHVAQLGYDTVRTAAMALEFGESVEVELRLGARPILLEPLTVTARVRDESIYARERREYYERIERYSRFGASARILPRAELARRGLDGWQLAAVVREYQPPAGRRGACAYYWNGTHVQAELFPDDLSVSSVEGVEMYDWSAPSTISFLRPDARCHIIVWTRDDVGRPPTLKRFLAAAAATLVILLLMR
jgi:hypothetical protein